MLRLASLVTIAAFCALTTVSSARSEGVLTSVAPGRPGPDVLELSKYSYIVK